MKTQKGFQENKKNLFLVLVFSLFTVSVCNAQTWGEMKSWLTTGGGVETLARFAHPADGFMKYTVESQSSDNIVISIKYEGIFRTYWATYRITRGYYDGDYIFKYIDVTSEVAIPASFDGLDVLVSNLPASDQEEFDELSLDIYGCSWYSLSGAKKAALMLTALFYTSY